MIDRLANLRYLLSKKEEIPYPEGLVPKWNKMGWDTERFQCYSMDHADIVPSGPYREPVLLRATKIPDPQEFYNRPAGSADLPIPDHVPPWVKEQRQIRVQGQPYQFFSGGVISDGMYRPPFRVCSTQSFNYTFGVIQSVWLHNDLHYEPVTREFDLFENDAEHGLWFAYHYGDKNYTNRKMHNSPLCFRPRVGTVDFELTATKATWWLNGKKIKIVKGDFDYNYYLLASLIVTTPNAKEAPWTGHHINIE